MNVSLIDSLQESKPDLNKASGLDGYKAFHQSPNKATQKRLHLKQKGQIGSVLSYAYISRIEYTGSRLLSILYHDAIIHLKGYQLDQLVEPLQDETIRYLQEFDPDQFELIDHQAQTAQIFIQDIEIINIGIS